MKLKGLAAVVTGGASGLGRATAEALSHAGARVAVIDVNERSAREVADSIGGLAVGCDITDSAALQTALETAESTLRGIRVCVNCAGIGPAKRILGRDGPMRLEEFSRVISVNLVAAFDVMRLVSAQMAKLDPLESGERGVLIHTASIAAYEGQVGQTAYSASKGGVASLVLPAARELARHGIRVLAIAPGVFSTPMLHALPPEVQQSLAAATPFPKRVGRPSEYAALAMHMIENEMLNGEVIRLDGGIRLSAS